MKLRDLFEEEVDTEKIIHTIKRDCKPFLADIDDQPIYRGMRATRDFVRLEVRQERRPKNMSQEEHDIIDGWMQREFGINGRSASLFVSGNYEDARSYGTPFCIFPIGVFEFLWSPKINDLYMADFVQSSKSHSMTDEAEEKLEAALEKAGYRNDNLQAAIESGNEIMIQCQEYYAFPVYADWDTEAVLKGLGINPRR